MASGSTLLLDEYFDAGDARFLDEVLASDAAKKLKALADRWYGDERPFARRALLAYIDDGCDRRNHRPLVKTLFKLAEAAGDDQAIGHFMVAFDRLARRRLAPLVHWDAANRTTVTTHVLRNERGIPLALGEGENRAPRFSRRTRLYLARRAFRYFRSLARKDEARYGAAIRAALVLYEDTHLERPVQILDAWGLCHALYWGSPVIVRDPRGIRVAPGRSLADLAPAPYVPEAWQGALLGLCDLVANAKSRTVRAFAIAILKRDYADALRAMPLSRVRALLRSPHDEVQVFAAEILKTTRGANALTVAEWLELLSIDNAAALALLCEMVRKTVAPERLALADCVRLACSKAAPVAELGFAWARAKPIADAEALAIALKITAAGVPHVREEGSTWLAGIVRSAPFATPEHARDLLDARFSEPRAAAFALVASEPRFRESTVIWAALAESPYDDARAFLLRHLADHIGAASGPKPQHGRAGLEREKGFGAETLRSVWATALLAVHRGGRAKRAALNQIAERIAHRPAEAESLLPLLGIALRSVRAPERRTALAALARTMIREPALRGAVERALPDLRLAGEAVA